MFVDIFDELTRGVLVVLGNESSFFFFASSLFFLASSFLQ
jgi:hypothetical protein